MVNHNRVFSAILIILIVAFAGLPVAAEDVPWIDDYCLFNDNYFCEDFYTAPLCPNFNYCAVAANPTTVLTEGPIVTYQQLFYPATRAVIVCPFNICYHLPTAPCTKCESESMLIATNFVPTRFQADDICWNTVAQAHPACSVADRPRTAFPNSPFSGEILSVLNVDQQIEILKKIREDLEQVQRDSNLRQQ